MSSVFVSDLRIPRTPRNGRQYNGIGGSTFSSTTVTGGVTNPVIQLPPLDIIEFTATATPTIIDYDTTYAAEHGQFPRIELIIDNGDGTRYRSAQMPQFTTIFATGTIDDPIDTIFFDLGEPLTGFIILQ